MTISANKQDNKMLKIFILGILLHFSLSASAGGEAFTKGPVFANYGENVGMQMSLSAMTSGALLQQQGFTLNPF
jgi:hypothetical protein